MICALECYQVAPYNDWLFEQSSEGGGGGGEERWMEVPLAVPYEVLS